MNLDYDYLDKVRRMVNFYTKRKTSSLLDGSYSSLQHGRSLDFDDMREYRYGDEVGDIDWKASSRTGKTLVRRFFADRKLDVLFVADTGGKMSGDTPAGESKAHIALMTLGVCAYLFEKLGANCALAHSSAEGDSVSGFLSGPAHLERLLAGYRAALGGGEPVHTLGRLLEDVSAAYARHMVMVVITDAEGLAQIDEALIRRMVYHNDVYLFKIEDAFLTTPDVFDLQAGRFEDPYIASNGALHAEELRLRAEMTRAAESTMTPHRVFFGSLSREEEIIDVLTELFHRRKGV